MKKKNFLQLGLFWVVQAIVSGILYAVAAFFTKEGLEKIKSKYRI